MRGDARTACIVFDFDGVLVDSNAVKRRAYFDALADIHGAADAITEVLSAPPLEQIDRYRTMARIVSLLSDRDLLDDRDPTRLAAERAERYTIICDRDLRLCGEIPGASGLLATLSRSHPLYVNSATPESILRTTIAGRGWTSFFRDTLGAPVTKADNLRRIALAEGIQTRQILFVGDSEVDRRAAGQVGCPFVGVVIEDGRFEEPVERVVAKLSDLLLLL